MSELEMLVTVAKEVEVGDPIDWGHLSISEDSVYLTMASHVLEMNLDDQIVRVGIITKLLVENMILNLKVLQNGQSER